jgi:hypothetical protein
MASRISLLLVALASLSRLAAAQDDAAEQRMSLMRAAIDDFAVSSQEIDSEPALRFATRPLLRYSDPTRGFSGGQSLLDATVWRLGEQGRPTALVTLEIYRAADDARLSYEFVSLTPAAFELARRADPVVRWLATKTDLQIRPLDDAPPPAKTASGRLVQMREIARRFRVRETTVNDVVVDCRLLSQPIDRYQAEGEEIVDGVVFAFANGTNPELGLLIETDGETWSYGAVRLSAAATSVLLGEREVASFPYYGDARATTGPYTAKRRKIELPKTK